jgi:hypothetical protein
MTLLSAEKKAMFNRFFGHLAYKYRLGDLLDDALTVAAGELTAVGDGKILVGAASTGIATARTLSGDGTISNAGVFAIASDVIVNADVKTTAAIAFSKLAALTATNILVGNGSNVPTAVAMSGDATLDNAGALTIANGAVETVMLADGAVTSAKIADGAIRVADVDQSQMVLDFTTMPVTFNHTVTDAAIIGVDCRGRSLQYINVGGDNTLGCVATLGAAAGINLSGDLTEDDGIEFGCGPTAPACAKVVDTDNFYFRAKVDLTDVDGTDDLAIGLRKAEAYQAALGTYTDYYVAGCDTKASPMALKLISVLNDAGDVSTDTTQTLADGEYLDVKMWVGDEARLLSCIELMAGVKAAINTHMADDTEHINGQQSAITGAAPTTVAELITVITEAMAAFVIHSDDANLGSSWVYHDAQTAGDDSLTSEAAPTTLAECVTRLNDLRTKLDLHVARGASAPHADGDSGVVTAGIPQAANVHCLLGVNGALAVPTVAVAYNFDVGDTVVPFIKFLHSDVFAESFFLQNWEVVDVTTT